MSSRSRARQWSRAALALGALFASLPVAARLLMGSWGFPEAAELACLCLALGVYLHIVSGRRLRTLRDDAAALEKALQLAAEGQESDAIAVLTGAIRLSPRLWQAYQYRGQLYLRQRATWDQACDDLSQAIRLAPEEPHLYTLRGHLHGLRGEEAAAQQDYEAAAALRETRAGA